jgi:hypothetical protein
MTMISKSEVKEAIDGARSALKEESGLSWVRLSALLERAYFLGVLSGLRKIANEEDLNALFGSFLQTMWARGADDTFGETRIGKAYDEVNDLIRRELDAALSANREGRTHQIRDSMADDFDGLQDLVKELQRYLHLNAESIDEIISRIASDVTGPEGLGTEALEEKMHLVKSLEEPLRVVSLLETDHKLTKRLGG